MKLLAADGWPWGGEVTSTTGAKTRAWWERYERDGRQNERPRQRDETETQAKNHRTRKRTWYV